MTLQQLQYIIALDDSRHFVTAAQKCFVTQPTITLQVQKLEEVVGFQIFDRSTSPLTPTPMGVVVISKARNVLREVAQLKEFVNNEKDNLTGTFKVGIIPTVAPYIVPKFAGHFLEKYPDTILDIEEISSEAIIEAVKTNQIDIGILVTPLEESALREIPLYEEPFVYYGDKAGMQDTVSIADVENKKGLWLLNSGHCFRNQVLNICNATAETNNIRFRSGSIETIMHMVDAYGGFSLIPKLVCNGLTDDKIIPFKEPKPIREVSLVAHKGFVKEGLLDAIRKEILAVIPNAFKKNNKTMRMKWR